MTQTDKMQANEPPKPSSLSAETKLGDLAVQLDLETVMNEQDKYLIDPLIKFQRVYVASASHLCSPLSSLAQPAFDR